MIQQLGHILKQQDWKYMNKPVKVYKRFGVVVQQAWRL